MPPSPPTDRVTKLIGLLAADPRSPQTLTQLAKGISSNLPTCRRIVDSLVDAGWVAVVPNSRTYALGAALLDLGIAARDSLAPIALARPVVHRVCSDLGIAGTIVISEGDRLIVLERLGIPSGVEPGIWPGKRLRHAPPSGIPFVIWQSDEMIREWVSRTDPALVQPNASELAHLAESSRRHGLTIERFTEDLDTMYELFRRLRTHDLPGELVDHLRRIVGAIGNRYLLVEDIRPGQRYPIRMMSAPVFGFTGNLSMIISFLIGDSLSAAQIGIHRRALTGTAAELTDGQGGYNPWNSDPPAGRHADGSSSLDSGRGTRTS